MATNWRRSKKKKLWINFERKKKKSHIVLTAISVYDFTFINGKKKKMK